MNNERLIRLGFLEFMALTLIGGSLLGISVSLVGIDRSLSEQCHSASQVQQ